MVRCDFVSIMAAIRSYVSESRGLNQTNFLYLIFESFISSSEKEDAAFFANALCFGLDREFLKRDAKTTALIATGSLSPAVSNFIFGNDVPKPCRHFCGRDSEIEKLHNLLEEHGKIFLHGIAGIGKSELAKAYASRYKKEYTNILYIVYSGDLKRDITDLDFSDDLPDENREERFRRHNRFLRTLKQDAYRTLRTGEKYCKGNPPGKRCPCYAYRN